MSYSGDAAEQGVRLSLEGGEAALRLAGTGQRAVMPPMTLVFWVRDAASTDISPIAARQGYYGN